LLRRYGGQQKSAEGGQNSGFSTYTARHSFATILRNTGENVSFISEALGHSNLSTTKGYLASFENDEKKKMAKLLTTFPATKITE